MKLSNVLIETIDIKKIASGIDDFKAKTGEQPSYIIMNNSTAFLLKRADVIEVEWNPVNYALLSYRGIKIAISEGLKNGEIEIL